MIDTCVLGRLAERERRRTHCLSGSPNCFPCHHGSTKLRATKFSCVGQNQERPNSAFCFAKLAPSGLRFLVDDPSQASPCRSPADALMIGFQLISGWRLWLLHPVVTGRLQPLCYCLLCGGSLVSSASPGRHLGVEDGPPRWAQGSKYSEFRRGCILDWLVPSSCRAI